MRNGSGISHTKITAKGLVTHFSSGHQIIHVAVVQFAAEEIRRLTHSIHIVVGKSDRHIS